jgi:hypothetical protein
LQGCNNYTIAVGHGPHGGEDLEGTAYARAIIYDEFFQDNYIVGDLGKVITQIKERIRSFEG